jgi:putative heme degradation protein
MAVMQIRRVLELPEILEAEVIYFISPEGSSEVQVAVTNQNGTVVKSTVLSTTILAAAALDATEKAATAESNAIEAAALDASTKSDEARDAAIAAANTAIIEAIGELDLTNNTHLVTDIDARNALQPSLTKSGFVLVLDATDDMTVENGAALYFYDKVGDAFHKVSEYESMDLPNMDIVADLNVDEDSNLTFRGKVLGTVVAGTHEW